MKLLMINPPLIIDKDFVDYPYFANLGVLQNASQFHKRGDAVTVFDFFSERKSGMASLKDGKIYFGCSLKDFDEKINEGAFDVAVVGVNAFLHPHRQNVVLRHLTKILKEKKKVPVIVFSDCRVGGMHYIDYPCDEISNVYPEVDFFLKYETENVAKDLIQETKSGGFRKNKFRYGHSKDVDLAALSFPDWDLINVEHYFAFLKNIFTKTRRNYPFNAAERILPVMATRGCAYQCIFCANSLKGNIFSHYRMCDLNSLREYIKKLKKDIRVRGLVFLDDAPNLNTPYFTSLLTMLNEEKVFYDFPNGLRADRLEKEHLKLMKNNITLLSVSAESGNQYVIDHIIKKKQNIESVENVARWSRELRIPLLIHYVIGFPGETRKDVNETLCHAFAMHEHHKAVPSIQFATPLPGTPLYNVCRDREMLPAGDVKDYSGYFTRKYLVNNPEFGEGGIEKLKHLFELKLSAFKTKKIIVNLTYRCNNHCIFCAVGDRPKVDADVDVIKEKLAASFKNGITCLDIDGGEPTLHDKLFPIICYARTLGYEQVNVTTNGRLLSNKNLAGDLLRSGLTSLLVSLHGHNEKIHARHTGCKESFTQTLTGIKYALKHKPDGVDFGVNTTITKYNYKFLPQFLGFLKALGVRKVNIQFVTPFGRAKKEILPDGGKSADVVKKSIAQFGGALKINIINLPFCLLVGYEDYVLGDFFKAERNMVFIPNDEVNLADWLGAKRVKEEKCLRCFYNIVCGGFYTFNETGARVEYFRDPCFLS